MSLFNHKSDKELVKETHMLRKRAAIERKYDRVRAEYREQKYGKIKARAASAGHFGASLLKGVGNAASNVYRNVEHNKINPGFKSSFPPGKMINLPSTKTHLTPNFKAGGVPNTPHLNLGASKAFNVSLKKR